MSINKVSLKQLIRNADDISNIVTGHRLPFWARYAWRNFGPHSMKTVLHDTKLVDEHYMVLGLHPEAHPRVIKSAYRNLAQIYHPDNKEIGDAEKFKRIQVAYERIMKERGV